ncbi:hypothetical protein [Niveispirillum irakense]|uniref:hypothetical protein n=1 Tax=Niveispirillum irakense TaxID=34011 RepID=UPI00048CFD35|nr:hypothetical protein [Niveispirillum irakense]
MMISLNANPLFSATNAQALKAQIDQHVEKAVDARFQQTATSRAAGGGTGLFDRLKDIGFAGDDFDGALKQAAGIEALSNYMNLARAEIEKKAAKEKLEQSRRRMDELEQEARQAASKGDGAKLARLAKEAAGITKGLAEEAKGLVEGRQHDPADRAAAIAAGLPDPAIPAPIQSGMTAGGVPVGFARAFVQEVRDISGRARSLLTQAETQRTQQRGRPLTEEERQEREEELKAARDDLSAADALVERLAGGLEATDPDGRAAGTIGAADVSQSYMRTETVTMALMVTETGISLSA